MRMLRAFPRAATPRHVRHWLRAPICLTENCSLRRPYTLPLRRLSNIRQYSSSPTVTIMEILPSPPGVVAELRKQMPKTNGENSFRLRSYQTEMVEESLKRNIIVTMDTGSGKTHIAIARCAAELESCDPSKIVWFLAPTNPLCSQQARLFEENLPAYQLRLLSGNDNVDAWSNQSVWDAVLKNVRIVVSTPQILLDALGHGFVKMSGIALLVFDEAHMCRGKHPASMIMQNFYHSNNLLDEPPSLPNILGLTATPVLNASADNLNIIEKALSAIAVAPKMHRTELIQYTHKPELLRISYDPSFSEPTQGPPALIALSRAYHKYDIEQDPYIVSLRKRSLEQSGSSQQKTFNELTKLLQNRKTYVHEQLKRLYLRAQHVFDELGEAATNFYLRSVIEKFGRYVETMRMNYTDWMDEEGEYLKNIFSKIEKCPPSTSESIPPKMEALVSFLVSEARPEFTCIIFATERATVAAMKFALDQNSRTRGLFNIGTFVGASMSGKRKSSLALCDLANIKQQEETLDDFRIGKKNLIISTSVLEEGIDISKCNTVICFDEPPNMQSFVQRRGRARKEDSKYVILLPNDSPLVSHPEEWMRIEEDMQRVYQNHSREIQEAEDREHQSEEDHLYLTYHVKSTGAKMPLEQAVPHLFRFCSILQGQSQYVDTRPEFSFEKNDKGLVTASVDLPVTLETKLRHHKSERAWITERAARNDAALQAYKAMHQSGLVNDNLIPLAITNDLEPFENADDNRYRNTPSIVLISGRENPWLEIAAHMKRPDVKQWSRIKISVEVNGEDFETVMSIPAAIPTPSELNLYWNGNVSYKARFEYLGTATYSPEEVESLQESTSALFTSSGIGISEKHDDLMVLFERSGSKGLILREGRAFKCLKMPAEEVYQAIESGANPSLGLAELLSDPNSKHTVENFSHGTENTEGEPQGLQVSLCHFQKPGGTLLKNSKQLARMGKHQIVPASSVLINSLPLGYSILARCLPPILHQLESLMVADRLRSTVVAEVGYNDLELVLRALSASQAEDLDYQRLEFLGDTILKFITCVNLMADHLKWPESFLTKRKDGLVSNRVLTKASLNAGLDRFLNLHPFVQEKKWRLQSASEILEESELTMRKASSKTIADVVESLIGAAFIEGGIPKALRCIQTLLPINPWKSIDEQRLTLASYYTSQAELLAKPIHLEPLEELLGYKFRNRLILLEAMTHASCTNFRGGATGSYERLEFLGDSVLDLIVGRRIFAHGQELSPGTMHELKTTAVSLSMLTFLFFERTQTRSLSRVKVDKNTGEAVIEEEAEHKRVDLWHWIRHSSPALLESLRTCKARHEKMRDAMWHALHNDKYFPWILFEEGEIETKVASDVLEAIIGAIFIDSIQNCTPTTGAIDPFGNPNADDPNPLTSQTSGLAACEDFLGRIGLLDILDRLLRDKVNCLNPRARLLDFIPASLRDSLKYRPVYDEKKEIWRCMVLLGDRVLVEENAIATPKKMIAIRMASNLCLWVLNQGKAAGKRVYNIGRQATRVELGMQEDFKESDDEYESAVETMDLDQNVWSSDNEDEFFDAADPQALLDGYGESEHIDEHVDIIGLVEAYDYTDDALLTEGSITFADTKQSKVGEDAEEEVDEEMGEAAEENARDEDEEMEDAKGEEVKDVEELDDTKGPKPTNLLDWSAVSRSKIASLQNDALKRMEYGEKWRVRGVEGFFQTTTKAGTAAYIRPGQTSLEPSKLRELAKSAELRDLQIKEIGRKLRASSAPPSPDRPSLSIRRASPSTRRSSMSARSTSSSGSTFSESRGKRRLKKHIRKCIRRAERFKAEGREDSKLTYYLAKHNSLPS
ncbi:hypothetical protein HDK90DRAFT_473913 [Phyllosticta capitalensis]|uniref:Dicer-like protein 2 n=1 Tax=Phyllosticta capitalensis TaxID=121624 RepID=A0ABR1Z4C6_9PEZI